MKRTRGLWVWPVTAVLLLALLPVGVGAADPKLVPRGKLPIFRPHDAADFSSNGSLLLDRKRRIGYQVFALTRGTGVQSFNLDTLEPLAYKSFAFTASTPVGITSGEFIQAVDENSGRLYFAFLDSLSLFGGFVVLDGPTLTQIKTFRREDAPPTPASNGLCTSTSSCVPLPAGVAAGLRGIDITPSALSGGSPKILLLMQEQRAPGTENNFNIVWASQWDTQTGKQDWIYRVAACGNFKLPIHPQSRYQLSLFQSRHGSSVYLACQGAGGTGQVVRLLTDASGRPVVEEVFPGPLGVADVLSDPESDRMLMRVMNEEGESWWVFDGDSSAYVGVIGMTLEPVPASSGVDPFTGRLYTLAPSTQKGRQRNAGGLLIADARRSPVPQALAFEDQAGNGVMRIQADSGEDLATRVFVRRGTDAFFTVYEDSVEVSTDPPLEDQDRFTTDEPENPATTASNFTGTAHGYGLRALFVGGVEGLPPGGPSVGSIRPGRSGIASAGSPCGRADREIVFGFVRQAALSNNLAGAAAIPLEADPGTKTDAAEVVSRCWARPQPLGADPFQSFWPRPDLDADRDGNNDADEALGTTWPTKAAECSNDGTGNAGTTNLPGYTAEVNCAQSDAQPKVLASARSQNLTLSPPNAGGVNFGPLKVVDTSSQVSLMKTTDRGLVVHSESWARGVEVPGVFRIEAAGTVAESFAGGQPGTAGTKFSRILCGVSIPSQKVDVQGCVLPESNVSPQIESALGKSPIETQLNRALSGRARVVFPEPDPGLSRGTPGGYLASIQKDRGQEVSARAINNDASTQVPAIEMSVFNDDPTLGRGRQIYQIAGVDASATYGIYLLNALGLEGLGDVDLAAGDTLPDVPLTEVLSEIAYGPLPEIGGVAAPPVVAGAVGNAIARTVKRFAYGLSFLLRRPREGLLATMIWMVLGAPVYLAMRRRAIRVTIS